MEVLWDLLLWSQFLSENNESGTKRVIRSRAFKNGQTKLFLGGSKMVKKKALMSRFWVFWSKILIFGPFLTIFDPKNKNFQNRKKTFLTHVPRSSHTKNYVSKSKIETCSLRTAFWPKILIFGYFLTIFDPKNLNFQNRKKKTFLFMSQGPLIPKIMFPSQKLWPVASGQTDGQTDVKVKTEDHFFRLQEFLPSAND